MGTDQDGRDAPQGDGLSPQDPQGDGLSPQEDCKTCNGTGKIKVKRMKSFNFEITMNAKDRDDFIRKLYRKSTDELQHNIKEGCPPFPFVFANRFSLGSVPATQHQGGERMKTFTLKVALYTDRNDFIDKLLFKLGQHFPTSRK